MADNSVFSAIFYSFLFFKRSTEFFLRSQCGHWSLHAPISASTIIVRADIPQPMHDTAVIRELYYTSASMATRISYIYMTYKRDPRRSYGKQGLRVVTGSAKIIHPDDVGRDAKREYDGISLPPNEKGRNSIIWQLFRSSKSKFNIDFQFLYFSYIFYYYFYYYFSYIFPF